MNKKWRLKNLNLKNYKNINNNFLFCLIPLLLLVPAITARMIAPRFQRPFGFPASLW